jgi:hypothetical protein
MRWSEGNAYVEVPLMKAVEIRIWSFWGVELQERAFGHVEEKVREYLKQNRLFWCWVIDFER